MLNAVVEQTDLGALYSPSCSEPKKHRHRAMYGHDRSWVFFLGTLESLFHSGKKKKKHRLKNLIRWSLYLETTCFPVNTALPQKEAKNGPAQLFSGKEPITFGDLNSWTQSDSWKRQHVTKIRDIAECSILKFDPKTQFMSCWFYWREEVFSKGPFSPNPFPCSFAPSVPQDFQYPWKVFALQK